MCSGFPDLGDNFLSLIKARCVRYESCSGKLAHITLKVPNFVEQTEFDEYIAF